MTRRTVLRHTTLATAAGLAASHLRPSAWAAPVGANTTIRLGLIGCGAKGTAHVNQLLKRTDVRLVALCDIDPAQLAKLSATLAAAGSNHTVPTAPFTTGDARTLLARADIDAVLIATPNHWHALLTIWACQAGKDVYVEKPMSHTIWEGRKMVEAAAKYARVVQVGTQYRSETGLAAGIAFLHAGGLGKLRHVHAVYYGKRDAVARRAPWYPTGLDYDAWCGPAPAAPITREALHYDWHWSWATGNGDLGNNGVHLLDVARRIVRAEGPPRRVLGLGGRYVHDDSAETPNTQLAVYDYPGAPVIFEQRGLPAKPGVNYMDQASGLRVGIVAHCEGGTLAGLIGCTAHDPSGKVIKNFPGDGGVVNHMDNFLAAVRTRRPQDLAAPPAVGHPSAAICHYGNISVRTGAPATPAAIATALGDQPAAAAVATNLQTHLGVHGVDLAARPFTLGPWLDLDPAGDTITAASTPAALAPARQLLREPQRRSYAIPETV
jgi:predicted dehydrogenase